MPVNGDTSANADKLSGIEEETDLYEAFAPHVDTTQINVLPATPPGEYHEKTMPRNKPYSIEIRSKIIELYESGHSMRRVSILLNLSKTATQKIIKRYLATGSIEPLSRWRKGDEKKRKPKNKYATEGISDDGLEDDDALDDNNFDRGHTSGHDDDIKFNQIKDTKQDNNTEIVISDDDDGNYQPFYQEIYVTEEIMLD